MSSRNRQRLFMRVMMVIAAVSLADGIIELCVSGAVHQLALAIVMFSLIAFLCWQRRRSERKSGAPFIPPQADSA